MLGSRRSKQKNISLQFLSRLKKGCLVFVKMEKNGGSKSASRVNGSLLAESAGKDVILLAYVLKVHPNGKMLEVKTTDNQCIAVTMHQPVSEPLDGLVEFYGTSQGKGGVLCSDYTKFSEGLAAEFDMEQYNTALTLMNAVPNTWTGACY